MKKRYKQLAEFYENFLEMIHNKKEQLNYKL